MQASAPAPDGALFGHRAGVLRPRRQADDTAQTDHVHGGACAPTSVITQLPLVAPPPAADRSVLLEHAAVFAAQRQLFDLIDPVHRHRPDHVGVARGGVAELTKVVVPPAQGVPIRHGRAGVLCATKQPLRALRQQDLLRLRLLVISTHPKLSDVVPSKAKHLAIGLERAGVGHPGANCVTAPKRSTSCGAAARVIGPTPSCP